VIPLETPEKFTGIVLVVLEKAAKVAVVVTGTNVIGVIVVVETETVVSGVSVHVVQTTPAGRTHAYEVAVPPCVVKGVPVNVNAMLVPV
jgi:hypothetical protein